MRLPSVHISGKKPAFIGIIPTRTVEEFIRANCEYPGEWEGEMQRLEQTGDLVITAVRVWEKDGSALFHVVSFLEIQENKICALDEYWGEDGEAPQWRKEKRIGEPIVKMRKEE